MTSSPSRRFPNKACKLGIKKQRAITRAERVFFLDTPLQSLYKMSTVDKIQCGARLRYRFGVLKMPTERIEPIDLRSNILGEQVSRILYDAIIEGVLKGGDRLVEADLQRKFGVSRSPLREAFRDLEKKGLVVIVPRKGTFVKSITRKDIEDNFPVRSVLEGLAAKEAYGKIDPKELKKLVQTLQGMEKAVLRRDVKLYWKHHLQFHETFIGACGNEVLIAILRTLRMHSMWYQFCYQYYQEDLQKSLGVHQKICDQFHDNRTDPSSLGRLVQHHIEAALERFLAYLEAQDASKP